MSPGDRLVDVELLEDDLDGPDLPDDAPAPWRPLAARVPRRAWWAAAATVAVALGAVSTAEHLRAAALDERLADVAGLSAPLGRPLVEVWRVPTTGVLGTVGATVLTRTVGSPGTTAVDLTTGAVRWTRDGSCELVPVGATRPDTGPARVRFEDRRDDLVVCVDELRTGGVDDGHVRPLAAHVLDPTTGAVLRTLDLGPQDQWSLVGPDLVTLGIADDGHAEAARWSPVTGEQRWTYRSPDVLPPNDGWGSSVDATVVELTIGAWALALDADTGERVPRIPSAARVRDAVSGPVALADGGSAVSRFHAGGSAETTLRETDGSTRAVLPGLLLVPTVDDGSAPDRLLLAGGADGAPPRPVVAVDPATGATRWTTTLAPRSTGSTGSTGSIGSVAVVRGLALVRDDGGVTALDARTGEVEWAASTPAALPGRAMVTDGRLLLTLDAARAGTAGSPGGSGEGVRTSPGPTLVARDLLTGVTAWSRPLAVDGATLALLPDGTVLAVGTSEVVALRP